MSFHFLSPNPLVISQPHRFQSYTTPCPSSIFTAFAKILATLRAYARVAARLNSSSVSFPTHTAAMASVRLPPLLLTLVLAVVVALLLPSAQAFFPQQQLSSSSSLMKQQHQHRPGTDRVTQG